MNFLICIFPKERIFHIVGLGPYFLNRRCLQWNHVKKSYQLKNNSLWRRGNLKTRFKTENNFTMYETVQHNKYVVSSKLIMSQFLSTLQVRKWVVGYARPPTWKLDFTHSSIRIGSTLPPQSPRVALRVAELVPTVKMLKKVLTKYFLLLD